MVKWWFRMTTCCGQVICPANCGTLGSQACASSTQIQFEKAFTCGCNGGIGCCCGPNVYSGRTVIIRQGTCTEETRYITAVDACDLACVHEAWDSDPVACDTWDLSYIPDDMLCRMRGKARQCPQDFLIRYNCFSFPIYPPKIQQP